MKKIESNESKFVIAEVLTRAELKTVMGGQEELPPDPTCVIVGGYCETGGSECKAGYHHDAVGDTSCGSGKICCDMD